MSVLPTEFVSVANPSLKDLETDFFDLATEKSVAKSPESCSGKVIGFKLGSYK